MIRPKILKIQKHGKLIELFALLAEFPENQWNRTPMYIVVELFYNKKLFSNIKKDKINIATGITKEQALNMAKNLEFKGNKLEIVYKTLK